MTVHQVDQLIAECGRVLGRELKALDQEDAEQLGHLLQGLVAASHGRRIVGAWSFLAPGAYRSALQGKAFKKACMSKNPGSI